MLKLLITVAFGIVFGLVCIRFFNLAKKRYERINENERTKKNEKANENEKTDKVIVKNYTRNLHMNIFIVSCNTILYCVLYYKNRDIIQSSSIINYIDFILYCVFMTALIYLSIVDMKYKKISNKLNIFLLILGIVNVIITYISYRNVTQILTILIVVTALFFIMYFIRRCSNGSLGGGDVKFISLLPLYFNYVEVMHIVLIASIIGSIVGIYLMIVKKKSKKYELAYGLFLSIGCIVILLFS